MKYFLYITLSLFLLTSCFQSTQSPSQVESSQANIEAIDDNPQTAENDSSGEDFSIALDQARELIRSDKSEQAIEELEKLLDGNPENYRVLTSLGNAHEKLGNLEKSLEYYKQADEMTLGQNPNVLYSLATIYNSLEDYSKAEEYIERAIKIEPTNERYTSFKAGTNNDSGSGSINNGELEEITDLIRSDNSEKAIPKLLELLEEETENTIILNLLGWAYMRESNLDKAFEYYSKSNELLDNSDFDTLINLSIIENNRNNKEESLKYITEAKKVVKDADDKKMADEVIDLIENGQ